MPVFFPLRPFVASRVHQEIFSKLTNWTGACDMLHERSCWTNTWAMGQDGLVVMHLDFWRTVSAFVTGYVPHRRCLSGLPSGLSEHEKPSMTLRDNCWRSIERSSPIKDTGVLLRVLLYMCCTRSKSEGLRQCWVEWIHSKNDEHRGASSWPRHEWSADPRHLRLPYGEKYGLVFLELQSQIADKFFRKNRNSIPRTPPILQNMKRKRGKAGKSWI